MFDRLDLAVQQVPDDLPACNADRMIQRPEVKCAGETIGKPKR